MGGIYSGIKKLSFVWVLEGRHVLFCMYCLRDRCRRSQELANVDFWKWWFMVKVPTGFEWKVS